MPCWPLPLLLSLSLFGSLPAPGPWQDLAPGQDSELPRLLGAWAAADGTHLAFEPDRVILHRDGRLQFRRSRCEDDRIDMRSWGQLSALWFDFEDETLLISWAEFDDPQAFERLEAMPALLQVGRLDPGEEDPTPEELKALRQEFEQRHETDQAVRQPPLGPDKMARMREVDTENTARLRELVKQYGWIDAARFGQPAANTAFLIVQHSGDLALMSTCLPGIQADLRAGAVDGQNYALLHDRLQLSLGGLQSYGSQLGQNPDGVLMLMPCEAPEQLDERRASMGMPPIADYLALFEREDPNTPIRRLGPDDWD